MSEINEAHRTEELGRHDVICVLEAARQAMAISRAIARQVPPSQVRNDFLKSIGTLDRHIRRIEERLAQATPEDLARFVCDMEMMTRMLDQGQTLLTTACGPDPEGLPASVAHDRTETTSPA